MDATIGQETIEQPVTGCHEGCGAPETDLIALQITGMKETFYRQIGKARRHTARHRMKDAFPEWWHQTGHMGQMV